MLPKTLIICLLATTAQAACGDVYTIQGNCTSGDYKCKYPRVPSCNSKGACPYLHLFDVPIFCDEDKDCVTSYKCNKNYKRSPLNLGPFYEDGDLVAKEEGEGGEGDSELVEEDDE